MQANAGAIFAQFTGRLVDLENAEAYGFPRGSNRWQRHGSRKFSIALVRCRRERLARAAEPLQLDARSEDSKADSWRSPHERGARAYIELRRYNTFVPPSSKPPAKHSIHRLEARGILIIGVLILLLTLTRYWHHIAWGAR